MRRRVRLNRLSLTTEPTFAREGFWIVSKDVVNPLPDRRGKKTWSAADFIPAGTIVYVSNVSEGVQTMEKVRAFYDRTPPRALTSNVNALLWNEVVKALIPCPYMTPGMVGRRYCLTAEDILALLLLTKRVSVGDLIAVSKRQQVLPGWRTVGAILADDVIVGWPTDPGAESLGQLNIVGDE